MPFAIRDRMNAAAWLSVPNTAGTEAPIALAHDHNHFTLASLVACEATVEAIRLHVGGLHVAAKIAAVHLSYLAFSADNTALVQGRRPSSKTGPGRG